MDGTQPVPGPKIIGTVNIKELKKAEAKIKLARAEEG